MFLKTFAGFFGVSAVSLYSLILPPTCPPSPFFSRLAKNDDKSSYVKYNVSALQRTSSVDRYRPRTLKHNANFFMQVSIPPPPSKLFRFASYIQNCHFYFPILLLTYIHASMILLHHLIHPWTTLASIRPLCLYLVS